MENVFPCQGLSRARDHATTPKYSSGSGSQNVALAGCEKYASRIATQHASLSKAWGELAEDGLRKGFQPHLSLDR